MGPVPVVSLLLSAALATAAAPVRAQAPAGAPVVAARGAVVALSVPDIEASVAWYTQKLGLRLTARPANTDTVKVAILEGEGILVELIQHAQAAPKPAPADAPAQGIFKAGFFVADFDATLARLRERGVDIAYGPYPAKDGQRANVIIRDNAGNLLQLFEGK